MEATQLLYLIDFGIAYKYVDKFGKPMPQRVVRNIRCSPQYAGVNQLAGMSNYLTNLWEIVALCRKDDIEGIFYTLLSLMKVGVKNISSYKQQHNSGSVPNGKGQPLQKEHQKTFQDLQNIKHVKENMSLFLASKVLPSTLTYSHLIQRDY